MNAVSGGVHVVLKYEARRTGRGNTEELRQL